MTLEQALRELESQGFFERVRTGPTEEARARAASYFVRLAAYKANPNGDPTDWGWLRKGGGQNVDGYAEDALVKGSNPSDLHNVVDCVGSTGSPEARVIYDPGFVQRRPSDVWEAPKPLSAAETEFLRTG